MVAAERQCSYAELSRLRLARRVKRFPFAVRRLNPSSDQLTMPVCREGPGRFRAREGVPGLTQAAIRGSFIQAAECDLTTIRRPDLSLRSPSLSISRPSATARSAAAASLS